MDLFSLIVQALKESERLAADVSLNTADRQAAATLNDALKALRGAAFRFRDLGPAPTAPK